MRKIFVCLLTFLLISTFALSAFAENAETYTYEINNITVIFDETSPFDAATREAVAYTLVYGDDGVAACGILCTLFGHDYITSGATTITHCAAPDQPRCLEEYFLVQACEDCDHTIVERTGFMYITCCPNDA